MRFHSKRHAMWLDYTAGCDADGQLTAVRARIVGDTGAYASVGDKVLERAAGHACGAYKVPNVDVEATAVYTNNPPCGAMRGFGVNQSNFALEGVARRARRAGRDRRLGDPLAQRARRRRPLRRPARSSARASGLKKTLLAVRDAYRGARFAGIACAAEEHRHRQRHDRVRPRDPAAGGRRRRVTLYHSWTEMGQGVNTVLGQIACSELGLEPAQIRVLVDTERDLETGQTTASRATVLGGNAVDRRGPEARGGPWRPAARRARRPGVPRRVRRRLDDRARTRRRRAGHPPRLRAGERRS